MRVPKSHWCNSSPRLPRGFSRLCSGPAPKPSSDTEKPPTRTFVITPPPLTHDGLFYVQRKRLADLALEKRLPTIAFASEQWEDGVLATYGPNVPSLYRRAGAFVDKILKLLVNLKTAKAIGVTVPPTILSRADDVIES